MKTKIKETNEKDYPCLKSFNNKDELIVLFTSRKIGTCVHGERLGDYATDWCDENFTPFNKEIILTN
jgi:hypothetical protein